ncbi:MAG: hypothetical protein IID42_14255, partial [Planctomycetes bacterium]|nr:hypothetical protein [Planctomycetota bacterium]
MGKLLYEVAVQFGEIWIATKGERISLETDVWGESMDRWLRRALRMKKKDFERLAKAYADAGKLPIAYVYKT